MPLSIEDLERHLREAHADLENAEQRVRETDAEVYTLRASLDLATHKCITCGVAAERPEIASKGVYIEKWDSPQAQAVRKVVTERDRFRSWQGEILDKLGIPTSGNPTEDHARILDAIDRL